MASIITITVNPCIDISAAVPALAPTKKLRCHALRKEPGGGGINVSRVIKRLGGNTSAMYFAGGYTGNCFTGMLAADEVPVIPVAIPGETRENFVVLDEDSNLQYRFGMPGPVVSEEEWKRCLQMISSCKEVDYFVVSGSLPEGMPEDFYARIAVIAKEKNVKLVLDVAGEPLRQAMKVGVYMIKPNLGELTFLGNGGQLTREMAIASGREIIQKKQAEIVVVSMAAKGALLITADVAEHVMAPEIEIKSNVGAGDSMVAGIVMSLSKNKSFLQSLRYGVACGTAATMNPGTALCHVDDVERLYQSLNL